jgi:uncharacterized membrane protein YedE/YeeE
LTSVTERIPLDRIEARARHARPGRAVLAVIASLLFGLGWLAFKACAVTWLAAAWCGSAVIEGWQSAKAGQRAP